MTITYEIRKLGTLPWPHCLGKSEYHKLELALKALLGEDYWDPVANMRALHTNPRYRAILLAELGKKRWSADLLESVHRATDLARKAPLLGRPLLDEKPWMQWAITHLRDVLGDQTYESLARKGETMTTAAMVTYACTPSLTDRAASTVNPRLADTSWTNSGGAPTPPAGNATELNMAGYRSNLS